MINSRLPARLAVLSVFASAGAFAFAAMPSGATPVVTPVSTPPVAIDFSFAGFGAGGVGLPLGAPSLLVSPSGADDTALLQAAIDQVGALPAGADGTRGVLLLAPGLFRVNGQLRMRSEGVVLRGSGRQATTLLASGQSRRTLIMAGGDQAPGAGAAVEVTDQLVPAGGRVLHLASTQGLRVGARVIVRRPSTKAWIDSLGMSSLPGTFAELRYHWPAGSRDLVWDRTVSAIDAASGAVTLDAPVTTALEQRFGGATVALLAAHAPLRRIGIENLVIDSDFARAGDEEHAWGGIALDNVEDAWVRDVTGRHLVSTLVKVGPRGRRVSIERVRSEQPVSELGGYRRVSFQIEGQQVLVRDCSADAGLNDFASGLLAAGPNVFLDSQASHAQGASGAYESWASGVLYENVRIEGAPLRLRYDTTRVQAAGWTAANSVIWNSRASELSAQGPDGAPNLLVRSASPLYLRQLAQRLGAAAAQLPAAAPGYAALNVAKIAAIARFTYRAPAPLAAAPSAPLTIRNGRFVIGDTTLWGGAVNDAWWLGQTSPANALDAGMSISRFVPGREGPGLTENLAELAARVKAQGMPFYASSPAIWYDRRRDDHTIVGRADANVWAAFYELPWARSGQGSAQDGLSKYDLTRYNPWYFSRVAAFAAQCDQRGIVLFHHLYNNHNLLETAAHWTDFPWRPANNINDTGLPEPMPLEARDRIHVANQFYDVANPKLRALHRRYIFHVLDQLGTAKNIVFGLASQYSGPLAFQQFFGATVAEWESRHGRRVKLVLDTSKNVTDGLLADPARAAQVAVIDMRYWHDLPDGSLWAPRGGDNLAFREMHPREFGDASTPELVYRQVRDYRARYPDKAIVAWHSGVGQVPALMAGGARVIMRNPTAGHGQGREADRTPLDAFVQSRLSAVLADMLPNDALVDARRNWALADAARRHVLLYAPDGAAIVLRAALPASLRGTWFDPKSGQTREAALPAQLVAGSSIATPDSGGWLLYLQAAP